MNWLKHHWHQYMSGVVTLHANEQGPQMVSTVTRTVNNMKQL